MSWLASLFQRNPLPRPLISVGPIPIKVVDQTEDEIHRPWRLAKSVVGDGGCVSLLFDFADKESWAAPINMCRYYNLKLCPQTNDPYGSRVDTAPWAISKIETVSVRETPTPRNMCSVCYDLPPTDAPEFVARRKARDAALRMHGHVAFTIYLQLSGKTTIDAVKKDLAPLVVACRRYPGTKWISELGINVADDGTVRQGVQEWLGTPTGTPEFQRQVVEYIVNIPGLAGVNYTLVCDSPGYAEVCKNRGGAFWANHGLFDIDGNERPAADVMRKAAQR